MKFKHFSFIIFSIILLLTVTCVSATNDTQSDINNDKDYDVITQNTDTNNFKSYTDLKKEIIECNDTIELQHDYKHYKNDSSIINITKPRLVINGNNHIIDGSGDSGGFYFDLDNITGTDIVVNNLTFRNMDQTVVATFSVNVQFNNVTFINNADPKENVLLGWQSNIVLNNCYFESNDVFANVGVQNSELKVINSIFVNTHVKNAAIEVNRGTLNIDNCSFENISSAYGGAVNYKGDAFNITNSKFNNLHANFTGGVLLAKYFPVYDNNDKVLNRGTMQIKNCNFVNVSSGHNGGSIYIDLDSGSNYVLQSLNIVNCTFNNSNSDFGGSIIDLGGTLNIINSSFTNSIAKNIGGVLYTSYCNLNINDSEFKDNSANNAGAIYFDKGILNIDNSRLINNKATTTSKDKSDAIYANDADINLKNSLFENDGISFYANFAENYELENITSTDLFSMNNTDYIVSVENEGIHINLTANSSVVDKLPEKYNVTGYGWDTSIKNQGDNTACWAFATAAAIESSLLKATNVKYDVSEENIQNLQLRYFTTGDTRNNGTGFAYSGLGHSLSWYGIVMEEDDPYDERGMISDVVTTNNRIHLQDAMIIFGGRNDTIDSIKKAIITYGPVSIQYHPFTVKYNYYYKGYAQPKHFVPLVGWDDTIPADLFKQEDNSSKNITPPGPGGWVMKECEGENYGFNGYEYLSYYDTSFLNMDKYAIVGQNAGIAYIFNNTHDYHVNYQTDLTGLTGFDDNYTHYSNEFTSKYDEYIGAVGTYFNDSGIDYLFDIFVNDKLVHSQNGVSEFAGFRTIVLDKYVPIKKDDKFKVVFKSNAVPYQAFSRQHYINNMSFVSNDGEKWIDLATINKTVCLKVYTINSTDDNDNNTTPTNNSSMIPRKHTHSYNTRIQNNNVLKSSGNVHIIKLAPDNQIIYRGNSLTLEALNNIFGINFTNGHLLVYIDGELVFNDTVNDDITTIIVELIEKYLGKHEIKVEFTDNTNKTSTYKENIIIE